MQVGVVTLFPQLFQAFSETSLVGKACESGVLGIMLEDLREQGVGKHRSVDDTPYGGGSGMVMRADCLVKAIEHCQSRFATVVASPVLLMSPQGCRFTQATAQRLARLPGMILVCGRYEGYDERVRDFVDEEISIGDFVMCGGEIAAQAVIESVARLLPGVLGNAESLRSESFSSALEGGLEYPQYTRPVEFRGRTVPEVLLSGDHRRIERWRREQSEKRTQQRRPDLLESE